MDTEFEPRRAEPGQVFTYTDMTSGHQVDVSADESGVIEPRNDQERVLFDSYDLPVARKALAERKAEQKEGEG